MKDLHRLLNLEAQHAVKRVRASTCRRALGAALPLAQNFPKPERQSDRAQTLNLWLGAESLSIRLLGDSREASPALEQA